MSPADTNKAEWQKWLSMPPDDRAWHAQPPRQCWACRSYTGKGDGYGSCSHHSNNTDAVGHCVHWTEAPGRLARTIHRNEPKFFKRYA